MTDLSDRLNVYAKNAGNLRDDIQGTMSDLDVLNAYQAEIEAKAAAMGRSDIIEQMRHDLNFDDSPEKAAVKGEYDQMVTKTKRNMALSTVVGLSAAAATFFLIGKKDENTNRYGARAASGIAVGALTGGAVAMMSMKQAADEVQEVGHKIQDIVLADNDRSLAVMQAYDQALDNMAAQASSPHASNALSEQALTNADRSR